MGCGEDALACSVMPRQEALCTSGLEACPATQELTTPQLTVQLIQFCVINIHNSHYL